MICTECSQPMQNRGSYTTLVAYFNSGCPLGNNHDDNCKGTEYICINGHRKIIHQRNTCPCGWKGKLTCFCHLGEKIELD